jgi:surface protein
MPSGWDVSSVTSMAHMCPDASFFDQDISGGDVSSVIDFASMFERAASFNQDNSGGRLLSDQMAHTFQDASFFDQDISGWDVSSVTDMASMFALAASFNHSPSSQGADARRGNGGAPVQSAGRITDDAAGVRQRSFHKYPGPDEATGEAPVQ